MKYFNLNVFFYLAMMLISNCLIAQELSIENSQNIFKPQKYALAASDGTFMLLDTETGDTWVLYTYNTKWQKVPRLP